MARIAFFRRCYGYPNDFKRDIDEGVSVEECLFTAMFSGQTSAVKHLIFLGPNPNIEISLKTTYLIAEMPRSMLEVIMNLGVEKYVHALLSIGADPRGGLSSYGNRYNSQMIIMARGCETKPQHVWDSWKRVKPRLATHSLKLACAAAINWNNYKRPSPVAKLDCGCINNQLLAATDTTEDPEIIQWEKYRLPREVSTWIRGGWFAAAWRFHASFNFIDLRGCDWEL